MEPHPPHKELPETITPFVTQRPPSVGLEVTTPYSALKQSTRGPLPVAMATPVNTEGGNISSESLYTSMRSLLLSALIVNIIVATLINTLYICWYYKYQCACVT